MTGKQYFERGDWKNNKYNGKNTREYYVFKNGTRAMMPRYYRDKIYYNTGVTGEPLNGVTQAGSSYFTYKSMVKTDVRFMNSIESRLMRGDNVTNTSDY